MQLRQCGGQHLKNGKLADEIHQSWPQGGEAESQLWGVQIPALTPCGFLKLDNRLCTGAVVSVFEQPRKTSLRCVVKSRVFWTSIKVAVRQQHRNKRIPELDDPLNILLMDPF